MEAIETRKRVRRFKRRSKDEAPRIQLTRRDDAILLLLHEHRFLDSRQIAEFLSSQGWSETETKRRLRKLYELRFIDKPEEQLKYQLEEGSRPTVYGLGDEGAGYLERRYGLFRSSARQRDKNRGVKREHVEHNLLLAEVLLSLARACHLRGNVRFIPGEEILARASAEVRGAMKPFKWQVEAEWERSKLRLPVEPDKMFGLEFAELPEDRNRLWFMLEADTGTETVTPENLLNTRKPTLFHKFLAYRTTFEQGLHTKRYDLPTFRVLTLTAKIGAQVRINPKTGERREITRLMSLQEAATLARGKRPPGFYLFADLKVLLEHPDVLSMPWQDASGKSVVLAPKQ